MAVGQVWCRVTVFGPDGCVLYSRTLSGYGAPDLGAIDLLAQLRLEVGRVLLSDVSPALDELLELVGVSGLLGQVGGQAEGRKEPLGVEERVDPTDSPS